MTPDSFATFSASLSGPIGVVACIAGFCGALIGLGAGSVIGWLGGYAAGAFRAWTGRG